MAEVLNKRRTPVINKRAFIYMFKADGTQLKVGQFEDWGMTNNVNTIQYLECGFVTALNIPLDYSFGGYLSKGMLDSRLVATAFGGPDNIEQTATASQDIFKSSTRTPYGALPKCTVKLVLQYEDCKDDTASDGTEVTYEYKNCVLFNHRINNARGIVTESLSFVAESLDMVQQKQTPGRGAEAITP
jgi:hypothetical protein